MSGVGSYTWYRNNTITADTTTILIAAVTAGYRVMVTDTNGCQASSGVIDIIVSGIVSVNDENTFSLYPNPVTDGILQLITSEVTKQTPVQIFSPDGEMVLSGTLNAAETSLNVNSLAKGCYFVKVNGIVQMFVKQ